MKVEYTDCSLNASTWTSHPSLFWPSPVSLFHPNTITSFCPISSLLPSLGSTCFLCLGYPRLPPPPCPRHFCLSKLFFSLKLSSDPTPSRKPSQIPPWKWIFPSPRPSALGASYNFSHSFPSFRFTYVCVSGWNLECRDVLISTALSCTQCGTLPMCSVGAQ